MDDRGYHTIWDITGACATLLRSEKTVSYTHLTLPTIYSV